MTAVAPVRVLSECEQSGRTYDRMHSSSFLLAGDRGPTLTRWHARLGGVNAAYGHRPPQ